MRPVYTQSPGDKSGQHGGFLKIIVLYLCCFSFWICEIQGHIALTFPPARKYDLDFLDNSRTKAPCGMPRGN